MRNAECGMRKATRSDQLRPIAPFSPRPAAGGPRASASSAAEDYEPAPHTARRAMLPLYIGKMGRDRQAAAVSYRRSRSSLTSTQTSRPSSARTPRCTSPASCSTTSAGSSGGGLFLSQPLPLSQSRTNCLSNDGCPRPGLIAVGRPEPRAVGRQHFVDQRSARRRRSAEFELRVGDDDAALQRVPGAARVHLEAPLPQLLRPARRRPAPASRRT